jgi:hypothetical protein
MLGRGTWRTAGPGTPEPKFHYGCQEFREDSERIIQGRGHPQLEQLHQTHLASCSDCQRYLHRLEAVYRKPRKIAPLDSFARDREFAGIVARMQPTPRNSRRLAASGSVGMLVAVAAILVLALLIPSFGARLFGPPTAAELVFTETGVTSYDAVHIPVRSTLGHQAQSFARVIGGNASLTDADGRVTAGDSLTVGTTVVTGAEAVQVAFVGRLIANFQPETVARWHSASPNLIEIGLLSGTLAVRYDRIVGDPILQVRTPNVLVRVVGTVFTVAVDERGQTTVSVLRGKVEVLDVRGGRSLATVEAGFRFDSSDSSYRELGRREVAAALPLLDQSELRVSISKDGELTFEDSPHESSRPGYRADRPGQIPTSWTVPGLSDDPTERTLDRVLDPNAPASLEPARERATNAPLASASEPSRRRRSDGEEATRRLINKYDRAERERKAAVESRLERCRELQDEPETRFRAARCLLDFMRAYGDQPEAVEGLLMLGTLRMDFAHDYQSATRNFEEFLRRAPKHPKAELARYKLVLAAIEAGYIDQAIQRSRAYLYQYPDGEYVGRILQRFPELKSEL